MQNYIVAITGTSGVIYGFRLLEVLLTAAEEEPQLQRLSQVHLVISDAAREVANYELGLELSGMPEVMKQQLAEYFRWQNTKDNLLCYHHEAISAPIASGSYKIDAMVIIPCSTSTLSAVANSISINLIHRAAEVCIKERRKLIIVPRETPLSYIHLKNMLNLSKCGVFILPAMPAFYHKPKSIDDLVDFIVGRVLEILELPHRLYKPWGVTYK